MRWLATLCVVFLAISVSACAIVDAEKNNRGGYLDHLADDLWMKADSKKMRALRAIAIEASLARIAMIAPKSAPDRALLARRIGETTKRADIVRRCAFRDIQVPGQDTTEPCFFFDSVMVDYENALFDLALIALPIEEARNLISRVSGGVASATINPLQLIQTLLDIGREAFRYGRVVGAIYRDTLELEVQVWLASPGLADRVGELAAIYDQGNDNIPAWRAAIAALRAQGLEPVPQPRFFGQLYWVISYICGQIVSRDDEAYAQCAQPKLIEKVPLVPIPGGRSLLSGVSVGGGVIGVGGGTSAPGSVSPAAQQLKGQVEQQKQQLTQQQQQLAQQQKQVDQLQQQLQQQQRGALTQVEAALPRAELASIKRALCAGSEEVASDTFDLRLRERLREFAGGVAWGAVQRTGPPPEIDDRLKARLVNAAKLFPACNGQIKNPYEAGVYTREILTAARGVENVDATLASAVANAGLPGAPRGRDAILQLRQFFEQHAPPLVTRTEGARDQLDDALWPAIVRFSPRSGPPLPGQRK
jgi:hypothetical protein